MRPSISQRCGSSTDQRMRYRHRGTVAAHSQRGRSRGCERFGRQDPRSTALTEAARAAPARERRAAQHGARPCPVVMANGGTKRWMAGQSRRSSSRVARPRAVRRVEFAVDHSLVGLHGVDREVSSAAISALTMCWPCSAGCAALGRSEARREDDGSALVSRYASHEVHCEGGSLGTGLDPGVDQFQ